LTRAGQASGETALAVLPARALALARALVQGPDPGPERVPGRGPALAPDLDRASAPDAAGTGHREPGPGVATGLWARVGSGGTGGPT
ncbi:MAG: hypothetical protein M3492_09185, partial [Actinomycetota bacterium]|nr:hypothetical protein [Actinomycetota bacterium]